MTRKEGPPPWKSGIISCGFHIDIGAQVDEFLEDPRCSLQSCLLYLWLRIIEKKLDFTISSIYEIGRPYRTILCKTRATAISRTIKVRAFRDFSAGLINSSAEIGTSSPLSSLSE